MEPKARKPDTDAVIEDGETPARRAPSDRRPATRSNNKDEAPLETFEQSPGRASGDDSRSELSQPDNMEQPKRAERTARDEP
jgi:hypothetical protein